MVFPSAAPGDKPVFGRHIEIVIGQPDKACVLCFVTICSKVFLVVRNAIEFVLIGAFRMNFNRGKYSYCGTFEMP